MKFEINEHELKYLQGFLGSKKTAQEEILIDCIRIEAYGDARNILDDLIMIRECMRILDQPLVESETDGPELSEAVVKPDEKQKTKGGRLPAKCCGKCEHGMVNNTGITCRLEYEYHDRRDCCDRWVEGTPFD